MSARATGEFTRAELTKAGNVTELPKNFTDYEELVLAAQPDAQKNRRSKYRKIPA